MAAVGAAINALIAPSKEFVAAQLLGFGRPVMTRAAHLP